MPAELVAEVESLGVQIADWKTLFDQQKELTKQAQRKAAEERAAHVAAIEDHSETITRTRDHQNKLAEGYKGLLDKKDSLIASKDDRIACCEARIVELEAASLPAIESEKPLGARERGSTRITVLETKGDQLDNLDTAYKRDVLDVVSKHFAWDETMPAGTLELIQKGAETVEGTLILFSEWKSKLPQYLRDR